MTVTLSANYKEVFAPKTVEFIDGLLEDNYELTDILAFVDEYNEQDLVSFYEEYVSQGEKFGYDVVDAFVEENGIVNVEYVEEAYHGSYDSEADFAEEFTNDVYGEVPSYLVVDWQATWDQNLAYDFDFVNGFVFHRNF